MQERSIGTPTGPCHPGCLRLASPWGGASGSVTQLASASSPMTRISLVTALNEVKRRDPVLRRLVTQVGPIRHRPRHPDGHFGALARSIVFQQLAGAAARAIHGRLVTALGGNLTP